MMQQWILKMLALVLLISPVIVFADVVSTNNNVPIIYNDTATQIPVTRANPTFTIQLVSNPTTGYTWAIQPYNPNSVVMVGHRFVAPKSGLMGAPGVEEWTFVAKNAAFKEKHNADITFTYGRSWEKTSVKQIVFTVLFK